MGDDPQVSSAYQDCKLGLRKKYSSYTSVFVTTAEQVVLPLCNKSANILETSNGEQEEQGHLHFRRHVPPVGHCPPSSQIFVTLWPHLSWTEVFECTERQVAVRSVIDSLRYSEIFR